MKNEKDSKQISVTTSYGRRRVRVAIYNDEPSMTVQDKAQETDVNFIMSKNRYSQLPNPPDFYADLTEITDLTEAHEKIQYADKVFSSLPARLRSKFENDPQKFIQYLNDPSNDEEAIKFGLKEESKFSNFTPRTTSVVEETKPQGAVSPKTKTKLKTQSDDDSSET